MNDVAVFDLEADGLNPTKIWCVAVKDEKGSRVTHDYDKMKSFFRKAKILVGHNITRFDIPVVERILDIKVEAQLVDTLALSWYLYPERLKHGLEDWGEYFGVEKPKIDDWNNLSLDEYKHRCSEDVRINALLWEKMWNHLNEIYDSEEEVWRFIRYLAFKMDCAREQERSKWKLDVEKCRTEAEKLSKDQESTLEKLRSAMPRVKKYTTKSRPAKPFKKDGSYSATGARWFALVRRTFPELRDEEVVSFGGTIDVERPELEEEGNPNSYIQIKDWLYSLGWEPTTFDYKRNKETGDIRAIPQINSDDEDGGLCESVLKLLDKEPGIEYLEGIGVIRHRLAILNGFLSNMDEDGFIQAQMSGFTNTLRLKHKTAVNLPKVDKPYGDVIRGVLVARDGYVLVGSDMSSLEDRLKQHYIYPYDPDYVNEMNRDDYDPHLSLAVSANAISYEQMMAYITGEDKSIKPIRDVYKSANYACQYGTGIPRLAITAGITEAQARPVHKAYWEKNWAVKKVAEDQTVKTVDGQMWLHNPINGFWYSLRYEKDIFSTLVQGSASYVFDLWVACFRKERPQLTAQFHDEVVLEIKEGAFDKASALLRRAIDKTNKKLRLNRELDIDIQVGKTYAHIH